MKIIIIIFFVFIKINTCFSQNIEEINLFEYIDNNYNEPLPIVSEYGDDLIIYFYTNYNDKIKLKSENPFGNIIVFLFYKYGTLSLEDSAKKRFPDKLNFNFHRKELVKQIFTNKDIIKLSDFDIYYNLIQKEELVKLKNIDKIYIEKSKRTTEYYYISQLPCTKYFYYKKSGDKKFTFINKVFFKNFESLNDHYFKWLKEVSEKNNEEYFKLKNK